MRNPHGTYLEDCDAAVELIHPDYCTEETLTAEFEFTFTTRIWDEWHPGAYAPERCAEVEDPRDFRLDDVAISHNDLRAMFGPRLVDELIQKRMQE
jgi:hypothetical protein